jgi:hypothetical protein
VGHAQPLLLEGTAASSTVEAAAEVETPQHVIKADQPLQLEGAAASSTVEAAAAVETPQHVIMAASTITALEGDGVCGGRAAPSLGDHAAADGGRELDGGAEYDGSVAAILQEDDDHDRSQATTARSLAADSATLPNRSVPAALDSNAEEARGDAGRWFHGALYAVGPRGSRASIAMAIHSADVSGDFMQWADAAARTAQLRATADGPPVHDPACAASRARVDTSDADMPLRVGPSAGDTGTGAAPAMAVLTGDTNLWGRLGRSRPPPGAELHACSTAQDPI